MNRRSTAQSRSSRPVPSPTRSARSTRSTKASRATRRSSPGPGFLGPFAAFAAALSASYIFFSFQGWGERSEAEAMRRSLNSRLTSARDAVDALERESSGFMMWIERQTQSAAEDAALQERQGELNARSARKEEAGA
jgi:hypothetical protein